MNKALLRVLTVCALCFLAAPALADFPAAFQNFQAGNYADARAEFLVLASLGDAASQFNLGAMAANGQGGPKDRGVAAGFFAASVENGYGGMTAEGVATARSKLTEDQRRTADEILSRYGQQALKAHVLPAPETLAKSMWLETCTELPRPKWKRAAMEKTVSGAGIVEITVGPDGAVHDPEVLLTVPSTGIEAAMVRDVLTAQWTPSTLNGEPQAYRSTMNFKYTNEPGSIWETASYKRAQASAEAGNIGHQLFIGLLGPLDSPRGVTDEYAHAMLLRAAQGGQPEAQRIIGRKLYKRAACDPAEAGKWEPWLRAAVGAGDVPATVALAKILSTQSGVSPANLQEAKSLLERAASSTNIYGAKHALAELATSPIVDLRNPALALEHVDVLLREEAAPDPASHEVRAAVFAANDQFDAAVKSEQVAIAKAEKVHWNLALMKERLARYQSRATWTGDLFALP